MQIKQEKIPGSYVLFACLVNSGEADTIDENNYYSSYKSLYDLFGGHRNNILLQPTGMGVLIQKINDALIYADKAFAELGDKIVIALSYGDIWRYDFKNNSRSTIIYSADCISKCIDITLDWLKLNNNKDKKAALLLTKDCYKTLDSSEGDNYESIRFGYPDEHICYINKRPFTTKAETAHYGSTNGKLPTNSFSVLYINFQPWQRVDAFNLAKEIFNLQTKWLMKFSSNDPIKATSNNEQKTNFKYNSDSDYILTVNQGFVILSKDSERLMIFADYYIRQARQVDAYNIRASIGMGDVYCLDVNFPCFTSLALVQAEQMMRKYINFPVSIDPVFWGKLDLEFKQRFEINNIQEAEKDNPYYCYLLNYQAILSPLHTIVEMQNSHAAKIIYVLSYHFIITRPEYEQRAEAIKDILYALDRFPDRKYKYIQIGSDDCISTLNKYFMEVAKNFLDHTDRITFLQISKSWLENGLTKLRTTGFLKTAIDEISLLRILKPHLVVWWSKTDNCAIAVMNNSWQGSTVESSQNFEGWFQLKNDDAKELYELAEKLEKKSIKITPEHIMNKFDVFLSYNNEDLVEVKELARNLKKRGLKVWLDKEQIIPGDDWQDELQKGIQTTKTAAVIVGKKGIGPWQDVEWKSILPENVDRGLRVIPILLPTASNKPDLPLFLKRFHWVDFRRGAYDETLTILVKGIKKASN